MKGAFFVAVIAVCLGFLSCDQVKSISESITQSTDSDEDENVVKAYYDDGRLKSAVSVNESRKRHGASKLYYPDGKLKSLINYKDGKKHGAAVEYFESGNKSREFYYVENRKNGVRTTYWENGKVKSTIDYKDDELKNNLVEYNKSGNEITKYPDLVVRHIDLLETNGTYVIEAYFSKNAKRGTYYIGSLNDGYLNSSLVEMKKEDGKGILVYRPYPGSFQMETLNVIGKYKTALSNYRIVEKSTNVAFEY